MRTLLIVSALIASSLVHAVDETQFRILPVVYYVGVDEAKYVVPGPIELKNYSEFTVQVNQTYTGSETDTLSYTFPEELTGNPLNVDLARVPGSKTDWSGPIMNAKCADDKSALSCSLSFVEGVDRNSLVNKTRVADSFFKKGATFEQVTLQLQVVDQFLDSEPVGTLIYQYKKTAK